MRKAIECNAADYRHLTCLPRKRASQNRLLFIQSGMALVRLGKIEYQLQAREAFWIPSDCLAAVTFFPQSQVIITDISIRLTDLFPTQPGYINASRLIEEALYKSIDNCTPKKYKESLLQVIRHECTQLEPALKTTKANQLISNWSTEHTIEIPKEIHDILLIREARKRFLSGIKKETIAQELYQGSVELLNKSSQTILGQDIFGQDN